MRKTAVYCLLVFCLSACTSPVSPTLVPSPTLSGELMPFRSPTPSGTPTPIVAMASPVLTPLPSATPFTHTIEQGDTLLGIAMRYGVSLEELQAANPEVDPGFLVIGKTLIIPIKGGSPSAIPMPTLLPVTWLPPQCYPGKEHSLTCFMVVINDQATAIENLSGVVTLYDSRGNQVGVEFAVAPLNILESGDSLALMALFPSHGDDVSQVRGQLISALPVAASDTRYLAVNASVESTRVAENGLSAVVRGQVWLPQGSVPRSVWLLAIAYDEFGNVVGVRKLDLGAPCGVAATLAPSQPSIATSAVNNLPLTPVSSPTDSPSVVCTPFEIIVYSLGPTINRVEVLAEARP